MNFTFDEIKKIILKPNGKPYSLNSTIFTEEIVEWINDNIKGDCELRGKLYLIMNNLIEIPKCKNKDCNSYVSFKGTYNKGFTDFCPSALCRSRHSDTREKYAKTSIKNWGTSNPLLNKEFREHCKDIIEEKYGNRYAIQSDECMNRHKRTSLKNWGNERPLATKELQEICKLSLIKNIGVPYPAQNFDIMNRIMNSKKIRTKPYKETDLYYQSSLEYYFLELMEERGMIHLVSNGLSFKYDYLDKFNRLYVSDFYIKTINTIIEIKSKWTYNKRGSDLILENKNLEKKKKVEECSYEFRFLIEKAGILEYVNALNII